MEEWEEYIERQRIRNKRILKPIISHNEEFQGEWQDYVTEWLGEQLLYEGDNEDYIKIELQSERTGILVLFLKMLIKHFNRKGIKFSDSGVDCWSKSSEEADIYFELAIALADIKNIGKKYLHDDDATKDTIEEATRLTSNYSKPIETQIAGKTETYSRVRIYLGFIDEALNIYLESTLRHTGIDLLFITLYADQEIIAYIEEASKSKHFNGNNEMKRLIRSDFISSLENEEKAKLSADKAFSNKGYGSFKYIVTWVVAIVIVVFIAVGLEENGLLPDAYGISSLGIMVVCYIVFSSIRGRIMQKKIDNPKIFFPTLTMIRNMERFYFAIRQKQSRLWLSDVKKELAVLTDAGAVMPAGIVKIIEDMEKRNKKYF